MRNDLLFGFPFLILFLLAIISGGCKSTQYLETPPPNQVFDMTVSPLPVSTTPATFPTKTIVNLTPTPTISFTPTASPTAIPSETPEPFVVPPFKLAYSILSEPLQGRWVLDTSLETPFKVAQRYPGSVNWPWSHNGLRMAVVNNPNDQTIIELIDLETDVTSTIFLPNIPRFDPSFHFRGTLHWSRDDRWLAYYESGEVGYDFVVKTWMIDTQTHEVLELPTGVYFSSWSNAVPDQYLYLFLDIPHRSGPEENVERRTSIHIGQVGLGEPVYSFPDMGTSVPKFGRDILWSPDSRIAVSLGIEQADSQVIRLFFGNGTWKIVQHGRTSEFDFLPLFWSPDSQWIVLWRGDSIYLWEVQQSNEPFVLKLPKDIRPLAWTLDSQYLIYYKDNYLHAVNPRQIDQPIQIYDLSSLNLPTESLYTLNLWLGSNENN